MIQCFQLVSYIRLHNFFTCYASMVAKKQISVDDSDDSEDSDDDDDDDEQGIQNVKHIMLKYFIIIYF